MYGKICGIYGIILVPNKCKRRFQMKELKLGKMTTKEIALDSFYNVVQEFKSQTGCVLTYAALNELIESYIWFQENNIII